MVDHHAHHYEHEHVVGASEAGAHQHEHGNHGSNLNSMAAAATLHCLTGCAIGEILGLIIGTAAGLSNMFTAALAVGLAFLFGYLLSTMPLVKSGVSVGSALRVVLAADTLSIATMELVDNAVMFAIPGAMDAGLVNVEFWLTMPLSLILAYLVAYPVNRYLLSRGKGHALTHKFHGAEQLTVGLRRFLPAPSAGVLTAIITAFFIGGLVVAVADETSTSEPAPAHHGS